MARAASPQSPGSAPRDSARTLSGPAPQYALLAQDLLRGIGAGDYPLGSRLPTEAQLCQRYRVSRITARAALRELQARGMVSRRAGVGTTVERIDAQERFVHVSNSVDGLLQFTADTRFSTVSCKPLRAGATLAAELQVEPDTELLEVIGLRSKPRNAPLCLTRLYLPLLYAGLADRLDGHRGSVMLLMEQTYGVRLAEMRQTIEAAPLHRADAALLLAQPREAALVTRRWHLGEGGRLYIASVSRYPHQRYSYALRMRRERVESPGVAAALNET